MIRDHGTVTNMEGIISLHKVATPVMVFIGYQSKNGVVKTCQLLLEETDQADSGLATAVRYKKHCPGAKIIQTNHGFICLFL